MSQMVSAERASTVLTLSVLLGVLLGAGWKASAQAPAASLKDFESSMLDIGDAFEIIEEMTPSPAFLLNSARGDALARVELARRRMDTVRTFFADRGKRDGVDLADGAIVAMEVFRTELTRPSPDQAAALETLEEIARACAACHTVYREGDKNSGYRFKSGAL